MVKVVPYLLVPNGKNAIEFYEKIFEAEEKSHIPFNEEVGQSMNLPDDFDYENSTMHATIAIDGEIIYLADNSTGKQGSAMVDVLLELDSKDQIDKFFQAAKQEGCKIIMELEKTFWGAWFARFVDPFGIGWQLNYQVDEIS